MRRVASFKESLRMAHTPEPSSSQKHNVTPYSTYETQQQNRRFEATFEQVAVGMAHVSLTGQWLHVNQKLCEIVGYSRDELLRGNFQDITHPDDLKADLEHAQQLQDGQITTYATEKRYIKKDGTFNWVNLTVSLGRDENGAPQYFITVVEDIHARKQLEEELYQRRQSLQESQRRLKLAQFVGRIGTFEWDIPSNKIMWTPELEALYGIPAGGFEGRYENWMQRIHPDDLKQAEENLQEAVNGEAPYNVEFRIILPDGNVRWMLGKGDIYMYNANGEAQRMVGVNIDITERKEAELRLQDLNTNLETMVAQRTEALNQTTETLRQLNAELQQSNQELEEFAYVASHDLQEPLRKIQAFGNLLEEEYGEALGEGKLYLDRMRNSAARMRTLIQDLLTFSRVTTKAMPFVPVDLNEVVREVVDDLGPRLQAAHGVIELAELPTIKADPRQMYQMFQNLVSNAVKFHRPDLLPLVKIYTATPETSDTTQALAPQKCQIYVEDNGIGFDEKYLDRIFTVFQRLHGRNEYEGTGIGLAVVRKIVERHNGSITASSRNDAGATFIITLPIDQTEKEENTYGE